MYRKKINFVFVLTNRMVEEKESESHSRVKLKTTLMHLFKLYANGFSLIDFVERKKNAHVGEWGTKKKVAET